MRPTMTTSPLPFPRARRILARVWPPVLVLAALVAVWETWVRAADVSPAVFPPPSKVAAALATTWRSLAGHAGTTLAETGIGLAIGTGIGIGVAVAIVWSVLVRRAVEPLLVVIQTIPPIVLAPVLALAFGFGWTPRIVVVVLIVFFPVAIAAAGGFRAANPEHLDLVRSVGGSRWDTWRHVRLPGAVPAIFDGLRISAAYAVAGAAIAEQIGGARSGLGLAIARAQRNFHADQVVAGVVVIAALSLAIYGAITVLARLATPWHAGSARVEGP